MTTPSSGISYNPSFKDHQDVLAEAVAKEVEWKDKRAAEKRKPVLEEHYLIKDVAEYDNDDEDMEEVYFLLVFCFKLIFSQLLTKQID